MIYRTSQRGTYRNITDNLDLLSYRIAQISNKVASEKKINKPSDNPSGAATVLRTRTVLSEIGQYTNNVNYSNTWLTNTGNVMSSIKETIDEIYSKAEQGATDTYTGDQRKIIATEIDALFQSIIQFADSKYGDNYLLSGQQTGQQPFSTAMMIQNVVAGCENSPLWTGQVQNAGSALFEPRPDLPTQSQNFLIEVVQAGGIDSQYYAYQSALSSLKIDGSNALGDYQLTLTSKDQQYNRTEIKLVPGQANVNHTGAIGGTDQIVYSYASAGSLTVIYEYGDALTPTAASYDPAEAAVTVRLQTDGGNPPRSAPGVTARVVADAVNNLLIVPPPPGSLTASVNGLGDGQVDLERGPGGVPVLTKITFNNKTTVAVDGKTITVYLATENQADGGRVIATAQEVMDAINAHPTASQMVDAQLSGAGATGTVAAFSSPKTLMVADPYTLARVETDLPGTHNDLVFSVLNQPQAPKGEAGNDYKVVYQLTSPPSLTQDAFAEFDPATSTVTVTLGNSAAAFTLAYDRIYNDYSSPGYHNPNEAFWLARLEASPTTAADVQKIFNDLSQRENLGLGATLAEGNSGLGKVPPGGPFQLSEGYDRPAMVRVSQDGGLTWGPPTAYNPSEFLTGGLYYNSQLGHASLTTNLPGRANDVVFTANHMGTWGDDLRVEYVKPAQPGTAASVSVGPQLWNICVTLGTNADGEIITTADDVVSLVNNHAEAGQLVTASLANYHEGGQGLVTTMDCQLLQTGEPYEIAGRTRITPLGHAVGKVGFSYNPPEQASPDLIFQALEHGPDGNKIGVRYTTSADVSLYGPNALYQDKVSISYDPPDAHGRQTVVVHLATVELPSCPDPEADRVAYDQFRDLYPVYSCTTDRAVVSTAGDVLEALVAKNLAEPENALVWASMEFKDEGWDSTAKVGPTNGTVWLSGGDESLKASDHGVALKFVPDGSALQVGDVFRADVGWYNGDSKNLDINAMSGYRTTTNVTGDALLGGNGASDNVLDVIQRLSWGLTHNDSELVAQELPKLKAALEKVTTMETNVGTRIIRNQFVLNNLELNKYAAETTLSEVEDADFTRLITDLKNSQLVYEAVLGTTGLTTKLSLLNYL